MANKDASNLDTLLRSVAEFVYNRKRETLDLHSIMQGFNVGQLR